MKTVKAFTELSSDIKSESKKTVKPLLSRITVKMFVVFLRFNLDNVPPGIYNKSVRHSR